MWKVIYGLATLKLGQEDLFKEIDKGDEEEEGQEEKQEEEVEEEEKEIGKIEEKKIEKTEEKKEENVEETPQPELEAPTAEQQTRKSVEAKPSTLLTYISSSNTRCT